MGTSERQIVGQIKCSAVLLCFVAISVGYLPGIYGKYWKYHGKQGPRQWHLTYPTCGGQQQSPINIVTSKVVMDKNIPPFNLYDLKRTEGIQMSLVNVDGHTAQVVMFGNRQYVTGGGLQGKYRVVQLHFHWGANGNRGSEHSVNGRLYAAEMHIVLFSTSPPTPTTAGKKPSSLAVLGFLFKEGKHNDYYEHLLGYLDSVRHSGQRKDIPTFEIRDLLPLSTKYFCRYTGSLTTPPCSESVEWTIFREMIELSKAQLDRFRRLKENSLGVKDVNMVDNFRPIQKLNRRTVTCNFKTGLVQNQRPKDIQFQMYNTPGVQLQNDTRQYNRRQYATRQNGRRQYNRRQYDTQNRRNSNVESPYAQQSENESGAQ